ncbi:MAG: Rne/Rng family ribonuclease [Gemmataceae bacterium]|nr:Rne/Rng family ribonuclease [Gemmataceae bacterium]
MRKEIVVNATSLETRVAVLEEGALTEIFIERESNRGTVGNIYKGRVTKVLPGMQSAFVDIGLERDAFLYVSDHFGSVEEYERFWGMEEGGNDGEEPSRAPRHGHIEDLLKEGQEVLVQVSKESIAAKGARITSYVSLPGRFLVLMPSVDYVGVSRKIDSDKERRRLKQIVSELKRDNYGWIVRTEGVRKGREEFEADMAYLRSLWEETRRRAERVSAPALVHRDLDLVCRVLRDMFGAEFERVLIDSEPVYRQALEFINAVQPAMARRVQLYTRPTPIFEEFGIESELENALKSRVWLKSGGCIVINQTEALVAIDVNTGKYVGKRRLEDTVLKTNLEAVHEVCRQLRLRDLGGIIVVDLIDMEEHKNRRKVQETFEEALRNDRARTKLLQISEFGLVEITRQRTKKSLGHLLTQACPYCLGSGHIRSVETLCLDIQREMEKLLPSMEGTEILLRVHPDVARRLEREGWLKTLRLPPEITLDVRGDASLHHEQFDIINT